MIMVSVDVTQHLKKSREGRQSGRPGLACPYGFRGRKATFEEEEEEERGRTELQELCESRGGHPGLPVPNSPYGFRGRKATLSLRRTAELRSCVKVEVVVLGSVIVLMVSVDVKPH